jgi:excisionase family DNA binding protein
MKYETVKQTAARLGVTVRTVQLWAKNGQIPGVQKAGNVWLIPNTFRSPVNSDRSPVNSEAPVRRYTPMPLMNSAFIPGNCRAFIQSMSDPDERSIALAEYYYFRGEPEKVVSVVEGYLAHPDAALQLSAKLMYLFANLTLGKVQQARSSLDEMREMVTKGTADRTWPELQAVYVCVITAAATLLHLPAEDLPSLNDYIGQLPTGLKLFSCYLLAHRAYIEGDYARSLGIIETGLNIYSELYPIPAIYMHMVAVMDLMSLMRTQEARAHFMAAWEIARPDDLIEAFGEHHGLVQGMLESCLKKDFPEDYKRIIDITYRFSAGWRQIHNPDTHEEVADNLTTTEFTIAMLASRGWKTQEIAAHMALSERTVKYYLSIIYGKLGISNRSQLKHFMLH